MTFRQTGGPAVSAAKASISTATAYRFEAWLSGLRPSSIAAAIVREASTNIRCCAWTVAANASSMCSNGSLVTRATEICCSSAFKAA